MYETIYVSMVEFSVNICEEVADRSRLCQQSLVEGSVLASQYRLCGEGVQRLCDRQGAQGRGAPTGEREHVRGTTTLRVDVDATHRGGQQVDQGRGSGGAGAEDGRLLTVRHLHNVRLHLRDVVEHGDGHHRTELFLRIVIDVFFKSK